MFSPSLNQAPSASVRSSRRRQRPLSNEGSILQPKAKRQRSTLNEETFVPPDGAPEMEEARSQKIATVVPKREPSRELAGSRREIAVRGKKHKAGDRVGKGDGSVILVSSSNSIRLLSTTANSSQTTNDVYTVSKLPALPDRLRTDVTGIYSYSNFTIYKLIVELSPSARRNIFGQWLRPHSHTFARSRLAICCESTIPRDLYIRSTISFKTYIRPSPAWVVSLCFSFLYRTRSRCCHTYYWQDHILGINR